MKAFDDNALTRSQPRANGLSRRELLIKAGAAAALTSSGLVFTVAKAAPKHDHSKHRPQHEELLNAVNACIDSGRRCISHCLYAFQEGDTTLADCARKVHEMKAICDAFSYLLASNSGYNSEYAGLCSRVCRDCEDECRKHDQHFECRDCADACAQVVESIKQTFG
jgi:Cys-rich four helix bundle protein (predicted Tat secretion target)